MTPQERQLIEDLFDRLAKLEGGPRDPEAAAAIAAGLRRAPNAVYALVQTTLVQDEALKRANARIEELQAATAPEGQSGSFLDTMREAVFGQTSSRGSVPNVRPPDMANRPVWNSGQVMQGQAMQGPGMQQVPPGAYAQPGYGQAPAGGSFLGTAAAAAAGVVGGSLLLGSIRSMMGGPHQSFGDSSNFGGIEDRRGEHAPWGDSSNSDLARDAGINDIGRSADAGSQSDRQGFFGSSDADNASDNGGYGDDRDDMDLDGDDFGGDDFSGGGSDDT